MPHSFLNFKIISKPKFKEKLEDGYVVVEEDGPIPKSDHGKNVKPQSPRNYSTFLFGLAILAIYAILLYYRGHEKGKP